MAQFYRMTLYVCDLEDRIEINFANGLSKNIWIMD